MTGVTIRGIDSERLCSGRKFWRFDTEEDSGFAEPVVPGAVSGAGVVDEGEGGSDEFEGGVLIEEF